MRRIPPIHVGAGAAPHNPPEDTSSPWSPCKIRASLAKTGPVSEGRRHADNRLVERLAPGGPVEPGVAEDEDPPVGSDQPVALSVRGGGHRHTRLVERLAPGGPVEPGVAEGEDPPVGSDQPVAEI